MKTCEDCKFALFQDYGYSNYTVEGITFYCLQNVNPKAPSDRFYGKNPVLDFAENCEKYLKGEPIWIDVDCEDWPENIEDIEVKNLFDIWDETY